MTLARLYGRTQGHSSLAVVMAGFREVLEAESLLAGIYGTDVLCADDLEETAGSDAPVGIYVGPIGQVSAMFERGRHERHFIMVTPNSDQLPLDMVAMLKAHADHHSVHFMAPSKWATTVVAGLLGGCSCVPHGVSSEYILHSDLLEETRKLYADEGQFRVIHFSTSDRQRKGTVELILAWAVLAAWPEWRDPRLLCVMDYPAKMALLDALSDEGLSILPWSVKITDRADLAPPAMTRNLSRSHIVCQPSRGEGFGLIPLEALCCGVPVVATAATGHSEYLSPFPAQGALIIPTGDLTAIDDLPGSRAPSLKVVDIAHALTYARKHWQILRAEAFLHAPLWQSNWRWPHVLEDFVRRLKNT